MSVHLNPTQSNAAPSEDAEDAWLKECLEEKPLDELDIEYTRLQIERVLNKPCQVNIEQLLTPTMTLNPFNTEAFKTQLISNCRPSK